MGAVNDLLQAVKKLTHEGQLQLIRAHWKQQSGIHKTRFWSVFDELPEPIQTLARKNFELLKQTLPTLLPVFQAGGRVVVSAGRYPLPRLGGSARMGLLGCGSGIMPFMTGLSGSVSGISKFFAHWKINDLDMPFQHPPCAGFPQSPRLPS